MMAVARSDDDAVGRTAAGDHGAGGRRRVGRRGWAAAAGDPLARAGRRRYGAPEALGDHRPRGPPDAVDGGDRPRHRALRRAAVDRARDVRAQAGRQAGRERHRHRTASPERAPRPGSHGDVGRRPARLRPRGRGAHAPGPRARRPRSRRRQLERALAGFGLSPGAVDGLYDGATQAAVSAFYLRHGWTPFGPTDAQLEQLRTAQAAAAAARDARLQALSTIDQARRTPTPAEIEPGAHRRRHRRDAVDTAALAVQTAVTKLRSARQLAAAAPAAGGVASATARRDQAAAAADVAGEARRPERRRRGRARRTPEGRRGRTGRATVGGRGGPGRGQQGFGCDRPGAGRAGCGRRRGGGHRRRRLQRGAQGTGRRRAGRPRRARGRRGAAPRAPGVRTAHVQARLSERVRILSGPRTRPRMHGDRGRGCRRGAPHAGRGGSGSRRGAGPGARQRGPLLPHAPAAGRRREGQARQRGLRAA